MSKSPIVILSYEHSGAEAIWSCLAAERTLSCTAFTGILPLCRAALEVWRGVDGQESGSTRLAEISVRNWMATLVTALIARHGGERWCELAYATREAAEAFLAVFPAAKFVCVYRDWHRGAAGTPDFWIDRTTSLLDFEMTHKESCLRVRYEDFQATPGDIAKVLSDFLHIGLLPLGWRHATSAGSRQRPATVRPLASPEPPPEVSGRMLRVRRQLAYSPSGESA